MYKGIVFDLDGTLVDSPLCFKTIRNQLEIPEGEWILEYLETLPAEVKTLKHTILEQIELDAAKKAMPFNGVQSLLRNLRSSGIKLGIFTRNCSVVTKHIVETFELELDLIITRDDAPPKPDPTGLKHFLKTWGLDGHELLFVGDFQSDIQCGKEAGVRTALFTNGKDHDSNWGPDYVVPNYTFFSKLVTPALDQI
jgi:HAD superfamily hydrolase (TIGR01549 family)